MDVNRVEFFSCDFFCSFPKLIDRVGAIHELPLLREQDLLKVAISIGLSLRNRRFLPVEAIFLTKFGIACGKKTPRNDSSLGLEENPVTGGP
jgi:hypothetical protein